MAKIENIQTLTVKRNASKGGPIYANTWNDTIDEVIHDFNEFADQWNNLLTPLTNALPDGTLDATVNAFSNGLTGKTMFSSGDATSTTETLYWNSSKSRPKTLFEQFADIYNTIDNVKDTLEGQIAIQIPSAIQVGIADNAALFDATNVEDALAEVKILVDELVVTANGVEIKEEGSSIGTGFTALNFVGGDITAVDAGSNEATITVSVAGGGDVTKVGTPANNEIGIWTGDGTIEGDSNLTWSGTSFRINKTTSVDPFIHLYSGNTSNTYDITVKFEKAGETTYILGLDATDNSFQIRNSTVYDPSNPDFKIDTNGNVQIGDAVGTSADKLTLGGAMAFIERAAPSSTAGRGKIYVGTDSELHFIDDSGNDTQLTTAPSDIRLKENIAPLGTVLDKIGQLNGVKFNWNKKAALFSNKNTSTTNIGLIAQEVEKVFPELVKEKEYKSVDYEHLTAVLIEAIKELKQQVDYLMEK